MPTKADLENRVESMRQAKERAENKLADALARAAALERVAEAARHAEDGEWTELNAALAALDGE